MRLSSSWWTASAAPIAKWRRWSSARAWPSAPVSSRGCCAAACWPRRCSRSCRPGRQSTPCRSSPVVAPSERARLRRRIPARWPSRACCVPTRFPHARLGADSTMRRLFSPVARITVALLGITLALVLCAYALKILPDGQAEALAHRKRTVEALTVQLSSGGLLEHVDGAIVVLDAVVERNADILSAALRDAEGNIIVESGDHEAFWQKTPDGRSTPEFVRAPIYAGGAEVAALEVRFEALPSPWALSLDHGGVTALLLFVTLGGAWGYFLVLRRSLRALDPSAVIPERVKLAMDALAEGVIIMDEREQILLANRAFGRHLDVPVEQLIGKRASALNWRSAETGGSVPELPWVAAMAKLVPVTDGMLELRAADNAIRTFAVNATPVADPSGRLRGALGSFNDITELHQRNAELQRTLTQLEESRQVVEKHNAELHYLATRDPLTGCLNRRGLFEAFGRVFETARAKGGGVCLARIDIEPFKEINDHFGHRPGGREIALVAGTLVRN